jgi:hypothetical protein
MMRYLVLAACICVTVLAACCSTWSSGFGNSPPKSQTASNEPMKAFDFLIGEWMGKGWLFQVNAQKASRTELSKTRTVKNEKDGSVRLKESAHTKDNDWSSTVKVSYDPSARIYRGVLERQSATLFGQQELFSPQRRLKVELVKPNILRLDKGSSSAFFRTTIEVTEGGEWHETLQFWNATDGWMTLEELALKRMK